MNNLVKRFIYLFLYLFLSSTAILTIMLFVVALIGYYLHGTLLFSWADVKTATVGGFIVSVAGTVASIIYKVNGWNTGR